MPGEMVSIPQILVDIFANNDKTIYVRLVTREVDGKRRSTFLAVAAPLVSSSPLETPRPILTEQNISLSSALLELIRNLRLISFPPVMSDEDFTEADTIIRAMEDRWTEPPEEPG